MPSYTEKDKERAFKAYKQHRSFRAASKETGVHHSTIRQWHARHDWEGRLNEIRHEIIKNKIESSVVEKKAIMAQYVKEDEENLGILSLFKDMCLEKLKAHKRELEGALELRSAKDAIDIMDKVIKLERLIKGDPTEITQHNVTTHDNYLAICQKIDVEINLLKGEDDDG